MKNKKMDRRLKFGNRPPWDNVDEEYPFPSDQWDADKEHGQSGHKEDEEELHDEYEHNSYTSDGKSDEDIDEKC